MHQPLYIYALAFVVVFMIGNTLWNGVNNKLTTYDTELKDLKQLIQNNEQNASQFRKNLLSIDTDIQNKAISAGNGITGLQTSLTTVQEDVEALNPQPQESPLSQADTQ